MCRVTSADLMSSCVPGGLVSASEVERYVADLRLRVEPVSRVLERLCWAQDMTPSTARFATGVGGGGLLMTWRSVRAPEVCLLVTGGVEVATYGL